MSPSTSPVPKALLEEIHARWLRQVELSSANANVGSVLDRVLDLCGPFLLQIADHPNEIEFEDLISALTGIQREAELDLRTLFRCLLALGPAVAVTLSMNGVEATAAASRVSRISDQVAIVAAELSRRDIETDARDGSQAVQGKLEFHQRTLERKVREVSALNASLRAINSHLDIEEVLDTIVAEAAELMGVSACAIWELDEEIQQLAVKAARGFSPEVLNKTRGQVGYGLFGLEVQELRPMAHPNLQVQGLPPEVASMLEEAGFDAVLAVPVAYKGRTFGSMVTYYPEPREFCAEEISLLSIFADHAALAIENARLYGSLKRRLSESLSLHAIGTALVQELSLKRILEVVADQALKLTNSTDAFVALPTQSRKYLEVRVAVGRRSFKSRTLRIPVQGSLTGLALATGEPQFSYDVPSDARAFQPGARRLEAESALMVPMKGKDGAVGVIVVHNKQHGRFNQADAEILSLFANQAAVAIGNSRLHDEARKLAGVEERNRLARDIHDTIAQSLTAIVQRLEMAEHDFHGNPSKAQIELARAKAAAKTALQEARRSVWNLRTSPLEGCSLPQAMKRDVEALAEDGSVEVRFRVSGEERRLTAEIEASLYRIAQEALNNIRKHAHARNVDVNLHYGPSEVKLTISDDGIGLSDSGESTVPSKERGFGLIGMRERAALLGGTFCISSSSQGGVLIEVAISTQEGHLMLADERTGGQPGGQSTIRILVVDDHPLARQGISFSLDGQESIEVVGEACDGVEAVLKAKELQPDIILMDLRMPRLDGVQAIQRIKTLLPKVNVIVLTTYDDDDLLFQGLKAGARGYLLKDVRREDLIRAIHTVNKGQSLIQPVIAVKLVERLAHGLDKKGESKILTEREHEVLRLMSKGQRNKDIAAALCVTERTVKAHIASIFAKLQVTDRTEAVTQALHRGIISLE